MRGRLTLSSLALSVSLLAGASAAVLAAPAEAVASTSSAVVIPGCVDAGTFATRAQCEAAGRGFPNHLCKQSTTTTNWHLWICD